MTSEISPEDLQQRASHTVEKIGGTSMSSDSESVLGNIFLGGRSGAERYNRIFVVSAYSGITDKLLEDKKRRARGACTFCGSGIGMGLGRCDQRSEQRHARHKRPYLR